MSLRDLPDLKAFFCAVFFTEKDKLHEELMKDIIPDGVYLMTWERAGSEHHVESAGEHFHFFAQMTDDKYHSFCKRVFKDTYKLRGVAKDGKPRQYGKVKHIRDNTQMAVYMLKDIKHTGNYNLYTNISDLQIQELMKMSFKKDDVEKNKKSAVSWSRRVAEEMEKEIQPTIQAYLQLVEFEGHPCSAYEYEQFCKAKQKILEFILDRMGQDVKILSPSIVTNIFYGIMNHFVMKNAEVRTKWVKHFLIKCELK